MSYALVQRKYDDARAGTITAVKGLVSVAVVGLATVVGAQLGGAWVAFGTIYCAAMGIGIAAVLVVDGVTLRVTSRRLEALGNERLPEARLLR